MRADRQLRERTSSRASWLWLLAGVVAVSLAAAGFSPDPPDPVDAPLDETVLPTTLCRDYFIVEFHRESRPDESLWMLLDTGASHTIVDPDSLERFTGERLRAGKTVRFEKLLAGEVAFRGLRARAVELDHIARALGGERFDGILGFPTFRDVLLTLDYERHEVRIRGGKLPARGEGIVRLVGERRRPFVRVEIGGRVRPMLIDSGSGSGLVIREIDELAWTVPPTPLDGAVRIDRIEVREAARLAGDVVLGPARWNRATVEITDGTELIGFGVLDAFVWTFDQRTRRARMAPIEGRRVEFPPRRSPGLVLNPRPEGYRVEHVLPDSPAESAGIAPGDVIVAIDGTPVYERDLCDDARVHEPEGARLTVRRDDAVLDIDVESAVVVP